MNKINLKVLELRRLKGISQVDLANSLGVSFQAVSKWETGVSMPDITLLPDIAEVFNVSIDQLLGLKSLSNEGYIRRNTENGNETNDQIEKNKEYFWNDDYLQFLINYVWKIKEPIDVIEFGCSNGVLASKLIEFLPKGSMYTGLDNRAFFNKEKSEFKDKDVRCEFIESDLYSFKANKKYDLAICETTLRHMNRPIEILKNMVDSVKLDGLVVCIEVNREFEEKGLFINGIDYNEMCTAFDFHKLWIKELELEGRDYSIGLKIPFYMEKLGLKDIDVRMNDRVTYINPNKKNYEKELKDFVAINGWDSEVSDSDKEKIIELFMNRGIDRAEVENYIKFQLKIAKHIENNKINQSLLKVSSLFINYGRK